jgi:hypothetical protein
LPIFFGSAKKTIYSLKIHKPKKRKKRKEKDKGTNTNGKEKSWKSTKKE